MDAESTRQLQNVLGGSLGLVAGVFCSLATIFLSASVYFAVQHRIPSLPDDPDAQTSLLFDLCLYAVWLVPVVWLTRKVNLVLAFLVALPIPGILIGYWWAKGIEQDRGHKGHKAEAYGATILIAEEAHGSPYLGGGSRLQVDHFEAG